MQLKSGVVTLNVVKKIKESEEQMKRLCQAMQGYDGERLSFVQLQLYIKLRRDEFCQFEDCRKSLLHLCNHIRARDIEGTYINSSRCVFCIQVSLNFANSAPC